MQLKKKILEVCRELLSTTVVTNFGLIRLFTRRFTSVQQCRLPRQAVRAFTGTPEPPVKVLRGNSGLDIDGHALLPLNSTLLHASREVKRQVLTHRMRPTSPKAWAKVSGVLRENKVEHSLGVWPAGLL